MKRTASKVGAEKEEDRQRALMEAIAFRDSVQICIGSTNGKPPTKT